MNLTQKIGDTITHRVPMRWRKALYSPSSGTYIFTVKTDKNDTDENAVFQKTSGGGGITVADGYASIGVLPADTSAQSESTLYWDIQWTSTEGDSRTLNEGEFDLTRDVTRLSEPAMDVHTVAPPLLFFSYQSYLETTEDDPKMTEAQWVARLGSSSPQVVSTLPPVPSNGYALPYEGLEWFDPSDGSTSVWMWFNPDGDNDSEEDGVFVSQFPTPVSGEIPADAIQDGETGAVFTDDLNNYLTLTN
jgi:hypothetical protein